MAFFSFARISLIEFCWVFAGFRIYGLSNGYECGLGIGGVLATLVSSTPPPRGCKREMMKVSMLL